MAGVVADVLCQEGDLVDEGQTLLVLEAMKMQNPMVAEGAGRVSRVHCKQGEAVSSGALLVELSPPE